MVTCINQGGGDTRPPCTNVNMSDQITQIWAYVTHATIQLACHNEQVPGLVMLSFLSSLIHYCIILLSLSLVLLATSTAMSPSRSNKHDHEAKATID